MPAAVADGAGGLWLFWRERSGGRWQVRFNRNDGTNWQLGPAGTLPHGRRAAGRVDDDLIALSQPASAGERLWLFWARHEPGGPPGQTRWSIVWRVKQGLDPAARTGRRPPVPKSGIGGYHDREPGGLLAAGGNLELFCQLDGDGGWSIVGNTLAPGRSPGAPRSRSSPGHSRAGGRWPSTPVRARC